MNRPRYPTGVEIHAGDRIVFQGRVARVLFIKDFDDFSEFAADILASDWDFISGRGIFLEFEGSDCRGYDSFCEHDGITLLSRR
jgi:hypothetical protein